MKGKKKSRSHKRYVVKKAATLKDYVRILGMTSAVQKEAKQIEKALFPRVI